MLSEMASPLVSTLSQNKQVKMSGEKAGRREPEPDNGTAGAWYVAMMLD